LANIVEIYNKLVILSNSATKSTDIQILSSNTDILKDQLILSVFVGNFQILKQNKSIIRDRILLALDLNPHDLYATVPIKTVISFYRIFIHRDTAISETIKFVEKVTVQFLNFSFSGSIWKKILKSSHLKGFFEY
jgi:hypothetical protein